MDDRIWRNVSIGLGVVCALLIGIAGALLIVGHRGDSAATPPPDSSQIAATSATPAPVTPGPSSSSATTVSPTPVPGQNVKAATLVFNGLTLDAENDKSGTARTFTFTSFGSDPIAISVTKTSPKTSSRMCISVDGGTAKCTVGSLPSNTKARGDAGAQNNWKVTLVGYGNSKPTVDFTLTWPTSAAKVTMSHGRLLGTSSAEGLNGFTATFKPRTEGALNVQSSWSDSTADIDMTLSDVTTSPSVKVDERQYQAVTYVNPPYTYNVDSTKTYLVKLRNLAASKHLDLTVQISFP
ncbi:MAG: hypothetical protein ACXWN4_00480 [Candidatus Limnocylindrales bacterium]